MQFKIKIFLLTLIALYSCVHAQNKLPAKYVISSWNLDEGLPQSTVSSVIQTQDGYIWLATWGGLVRFDGVKFTVFDRSNTPGLGYDRIISLFEDAGGTIWINTEQGVLIYKNGLFKTFTEDDGLKGGIARIRQDKSGTIWLFSSNLIYKYANKRFIVQQVIYDESLRQKAMNGEGDFWFVSGRSVNKLINGKLINCIDMSSHTLHSIWDVVESPNGALWIATNGDGLFGYNKSKLKHLTVKDGLFSDNLRTLKIDKKGDLWITGLGGISIINSDYPGNIYTITKEDGLSDSDVISMAIDREGNYWVGTVTGGLNKLRKSVITVFGEKQGLNIEKLLSITFRKNGILFIGTNCGGIYELKDGNISHSSLNKYLINQCVWSILEDSKGRIWIAAKDLILIDKGKATYFNSTNGFNGAFFIWAIYEGRDGAIWVGCSNGLFKYSGRKWRQYTTKEGLSADEVHSIFEDTEGNLWVGTINGLNKITNGIIKSFTSIPGLRSHYVRSIYQDKEGVIWFGSYGGGLIRLSVKTTGDIKDTDFIVFTEENGLFDKIVSHIVEDDSGYFWMGSNRGITRVSRKELNNLSQIMLNRQAALKGELHLNVTSYGKQDGMVTVETNGGFQPNAVKDDDGKIYFPTVQGLAVVNPGEIISNRKIPEVHLEKFLVSGHETNIYNAHIPYDSSDIQIQYTALSYIEPKKVKFKYKIDGYDEDWVDAGTRRSAYYTKLPPGEFKFRVIAANNDGVWNMNGAVVSFTILPPFWMTWWFRTVLIFLFLSIGPVIYYRRVTTLQREKTRQEEFSQMLIRKQEDERTRIAQELHDSLGQELLLIKNRALIGLKSSGHETKTIQQLEHISESASSVINLVRQISHNLRPPELDRLGLTETLRSILADVSDTGGVNVNSSIDSIDGLILKENEINIVRILQEALSNIYKHSGASRIDVRVSSLDKVIKIIIADNGKGFTSGEKAIYSNGAMSGGLGLTGMTERVHILKGTLEIDSVPGGGTKIIIIIPV